MIYKNIEIIKEINIEKDIVEGYAANFDSIDSHKEMFIKGAFSKSIEERGVGSKGNRKIIHLAYHDLTRPIGVVKSLTEDEYGLRFATKLSNTTDGRDFLEMYKTGVIREHSVGFNYKTNGSFLKDGYKVLSDVDLFEFSSVVFGANPNTPSLSQIKTMEEAETELDLCNLRMETLIQSIKENTHIKSYNGYADFELKTIKDEYNRILDLIKKGFDNKNKEVQIKPKWMFY
jgi:HK97 family phage prohead protease